MVNLFSAFHYFPTLIILTANSKKLFYNREKTVINEVWVAYGWDLYVVIHFSVIARSDSSGYQGRASGPRGEKAIRLAAGNGLNAGKDCVWWRGLHTGRARLDGCLWSATARGISVARLIGAVGSVLLLSVFQLHCLRIVVGTVFLPSVLFSVIKSSLFSVPRADLRFN
ncbi:hypothetical protein BG74_03115 [Sodalis-like endosymbiont of Proechinophthirus fluctus]|nr:hypothetical protein BG74_03115 [Sodalis-like endosymbiont of Proechinophthirus fluctus]